MECLVEQAGQDICATEIAKQERKYLLDATDLLQEMIRESLRQMVQESSTSEELSEKVSEKLGTLGTFSCLFMEPEIFGEHTSEASHPRSKEGVPVIAHFRVTGGMSVDL